MSEVRGRLILRHPRMAGKTVYYNIIFFPASVGHGVGMDGLKAEPARSLPLPDDKASFKKTG